MESEEFSNHPLKMADQSADEDEGCCDENTMVTDSDGSECAENRFIATETVTSNLQQLYRKVENHASCDLYKNEKAEKSAEAIKGRDAEQHLKAESHASIANLSAISNVINEWKSAETVLIAREAIKSDVSEQNCCVEIHANNANSSAVYKTYKGVKSVNNTSITRATVKSDVQAKCSKTANHAGNTNCAFEEVATVVKAVNKSSISRESDLQEQVEDSHADCTTIQKSSTGMKSVDKNVICIETIRTILQKYSTILQKQNIEADRGVVTTISVGVQLTAPGNTSADTNCLAKETKIRYLSNRIIEESSGSANAESVVDVATEQKSTLVYVGEVTGNHNCESLNSMEESGNCIGVAGQGVDRDIASTKLTSLDRTIVNGVEQSVNPTDKNLNCIVRNSDSAMNSGATSVEDAFIVKKIVKSVQKRIISPTGTTEIMEPVKEMSDISGNEETETTSTIIESAKKAKAIDLACLYCGAVFNSEVQRQSHLVPVMKSGDHLCYLCDKPFPTFCTAYYHAAVEHGKKIVYRCEICKTIFLEIGDFEFHKFSIHSKKEQLKCDKCSWCGDNKTHLKVHYQVKHSTISDNKCPKCAKLFKNQIQLLKHAKDVHNDVFLCKECGHSVKTATSFFGHISMHKNINLYKCPNCQKVFYTCGGLQRHFKIYHCGDNQKKFSCDDCGNSFLTKSGLTNHHKKIHKTIDDVYDCYYCNKRFYIKCGLKRHMSKHLVMEEKHKKFDCMICKKVFYNLKLLNAHSLVHNIIGKPYFCDICQNYFSSKSHNVKHDKTTCQICGKMVRKVFIREHVAKHSNIRNELCIICGKAFNQKSSLDLHMFSHGDKKFICQKCGKGFNRNDNMKKHRSSCKGIVVVKKDENSSSGES